jgi:hypothetical protein
VTRTSGSVARKRFALIGTFIPPTSMVNSR